MKTTYYITTLIILLFANCKAQHYTMEDLPDQQVVFGSGGGISGATDTYILLDNGQLFYTNSLSNETRELPEISKAEAKGYFKKMADITFAKIQFDHPGNRYYFLEDKSSDGENRIVWGSQDQEAPSKCKKLYEELTTHLK